MRLSVHLDLVVPHYLYRCYDSDGRLLYIGCTADVTHRIRSHDTGASPTSKTLRKHLTRFEVEGPFTGRRAALDAESAAIRTEVPLLNVQHSPLRHAEVARVRADLDEKASA